MKDIEPGIKQQSDGQFIVECPPYKEGPFRNLAEARSALHRLKMRVAGELLRKAQRRLQQAQDPAPPQEIDTKDDWSPSPSPGMR